MLLGFIVLSSPEDHWSPRSSITIPKIIGIGYNWNPIRARGAFLKGLHTLHGYLNAV